MSSTTAAALAAVFKAYDVRGHGPRPGRRGAGPGGRRRVRRRDRRGGDRGGRGPRHAALLAGPGAGVRRGRGRGRCRRHAWSGWPRPTSSTSPPGTSACPVRCSPPATTRRSTTGSRCAGRRPCPSARDTGLSAVRDLVAPASRPRPTGPGRVTERDVLEEYAGHLLVAGPRLRAPAAGGRRRRQRHGRPHRPRGARPGRPRRRAALLRARRHLPAPRGEPDRPGQPGRPAGRGARAPGPTSAWPSTATPTAASSSTSAARWSAPRC